MFNRLRNHPLVCIIILFVIGIYYYYQLSADSFTAQVVSVIDGDTVDVLVVNHRVRVRLAQIDAPELKQDFGQQAKQALTRLIYNKDVTVIPVGSDQYQRMIAIIRLDNLTINREMVKLGMAWVYDQYNDDPTLSFLEANARHNKVGLWRNNPTPPWVYRSTINNK